ncbi:MAG: hypothetical protein H6727_16945, partial [Myxococcales bacterium]|nr:hypothetical protein [Myxococcales bacterium]
AFDSMGNLFVVDEGHSRVRKLNPQGIITTFAGTGGAGVVGTLDGAASSAKFWYPSDLSLDSLGNLYVVDAGGHRVRKIDTQNNVTTLAGNGPSYGYKDGAAIQALFKNPRGIASDSLGNLYVVDKGNYKLRVVDARRMVSSVAGSTWGYTDGNSNQAKFRDVGPSTIDTLGNVYLSDSGIIRKVDKNGTVTTVSGDYGSGPGYLDGPALQARFSVSIYGLAFNNKGELYIADSGNYRLRKLDLSANVVTVAGVGAGGYKDGPAMQAEFKSIRGLVFDSSGNLYIADSGNFRIRKLDLLGNVTTVAGSSRGYKDGAAAQALFEFIDVLVFDSLGNLYISEGKRIRKLDINGDVTTVVGGASVGFRDGFLEEALFLEISGMVFGTDGLLYVTDKHVVRCVR